MPNIDLDFTITLSHLLNAPGRIHGFVNISPETDNGHDDLVAQMRCPVCVKTVNKYNYFESLDTLYIRNVIKIKN